jgi:hypothetical protein
MPSKSKNQAKAMQIAAAGKSTLGIPKKVGQEFKEADKRKGVAGLPWKVKPKSRKA